MLFSRKYGVRGGMQQTKLKSINFSIFVLFLYSIYRFLVRSVRIGGKNSGHVTLVTPRKIPELSGIWTVRVKVY